MKREFLEGMGLEKEAIDKIMAEHGKTVESHKTKANNLQDSLDDLNNQLKQRDKDLKELKKKAEGSEELQQQLTDLQSKYDTDKAEYEKRLKATQLSSAVKLALAGKVHDADLVASLIDTETIELDQDGNIAKGLDEQIKTLQESKSFLFVPEGSPAPNVKGAKPVEGDPGGTPPASVGASFAKRLNESKTTEKTIWD